MHYENKDGSAPDVTYNSQNSGNSTIKWLRILIYIEIVSLVNTVINYVPIVPAAFTTLVSRGALIAVTVCMFQLASVNERYKKAAILRTVMVCCSLLTAYLFSSTILVLAASVFSLLAVYQEYNAHAELVAEKDPILSVKWHSLFYWGIVASLVVSLGSIAATLLVAMMDMDAARASAIIVSILSIPQFVIDVVYIRYLKKSIAIIDPESHTA